MIEQGLILVILGMSMVFIFMGVLIYAMWLLPKLVKGLKKIMPTPTPAGAASVTPSKLQMPAQPQEDLSVLAAIIAAASRYKNK